MDYLFVDFVNIWKQQNKQKYVSKAKAKAYHEE